jgi:chromate transport protein ChrA
MYGRRDVHLPEMERLAVTAIALGLLVSGAWTLARAAVDGPLTALLAAGAVLAMAGTRLSPLTIMGLAALVALRAFR